MPQRYASLRRLPQIAWAAVLAAALAGCASSPPPAPESPAAPTKATSLWEGRMALQILAPSQHAFSASFVLEGTAQAGTLQLLTPLGQTAGQLRWMPGMAIWKDSQGKEETSASVDSLLQRHTGATLPLAALLDWLQGINHPVPYWKVDLSQQAGGRIAAHYLAPYGEQATLRVVLDR